MALSVVVWLCATNHCLLAGAIGLVGCESAHCTEKHDVDHDHGDDCRIACDTLEKPVLSKGARDALCMPQPAVHELAAVLAAAVKARPEDAVPVPPESQADGQREWALTWQFQTRAARWPGAPGRA